MKQVSRAESLPCAMILAKEGEQSGLAARRTATSAASQQYNTADLVFRVLGGEVRAKVQRG